MYPNDIYILGNYQNSNSPPLTQMDEIDQMIKFSQINANYLEIGHKSKDEVNIIIDDLILQTFENDKKNKKANTCKMDSLKVDKCVIF